MSPQNQSYLVPLFYLVCVVAPVMANASGLAEQIHPDKTKLSANCSGFLPADAVAKRSLYLCVSDHDGKKERYACHDYNSHSGRYRVLFKGGRTPKLITRLDENGNPQQAVWSAKHVTSQPVCHIPVTSQVPGEAVFHGAGVCTNNNDHVVPCAVFRNKSPRYQTFTDYLSLYDVEGKGSQQTDPVYKGYNKDAMPAELAYQLGLSLLNTKCCQQRGLEYIKQAYLLFPTSQVYSQAYQQFKSVVSTSSNINVTE